MNCFRVDGIQAPLPAIDPDDAFGILLRYVESHYANEQALIARVLVDGVDIAEYDSEELSRIPLSKLDSVEVITAHPREIAEDTLQTLLPFCDGLAKLSRSLGAEGKITPAHYDQLIDGIETLSDSVLTVKTTLRLQAFPANEPLEAELQATLQDLLEAREAGDEARITDLLSERLPNHLERWRDEGVPALIRSRDS